MPEINQLPSTNTLVASDLMPFYSTANGDARKASMTTLANLMRELLGIPDSSGFVTQYAAPVADDFIATIAQTGVSTWLIVTPVLGMASSLDGVIVLPDVATVLDQQELLVVTTAPITFTITGSGATVFGAPASLDVAGYFRLKFDAVSKFWYLIASSVVTSLPSSAMPDYIFASTSGELQNTVISTPATYEQVEVGNLSAIDAHSFSASGSGFIAYNNIDNKSRLFDISIIASIYSSSTSNVLSFAIGDDTEPFLTTVATVDIPGTANKHIQLSCKMVKLLAQYDLIRLWITSSNAATFIVSDLNIVATQVSDYSV